ncbi:hypothetical protein AB0B63_20305 [Micromonospora sp. NPDC049081]|uniref:hypothetical protein n=1 Tax=Micromonospora sp. NPDC049081 TaxID=3155150 RepID=UPI0033FD78C4
MSDPILSAYRELGTEARSYADPDRALAAARRRRRTRLTASAVVAPLIAGSLVASMTLQPAADPEVPPTAIVAVSSPGLLQAPGTTPPLPTDAVRPAVLAYAPCAHGCNALAVLTDGRQFEVPPDPDGVFTGALSLSPDGTWLGYPSSGEYLIRNLTSTQVRRLAPPSEGRRIGAVAWSADSSKLLLFNEPRLGGDATYTMLDVATGKVTTPRVPAGDRAVGILPGGAVLHRPGTPTGQTLALSATDGRAFPIDLGDRLRGGETVLAVQVAPDGTRVYVTVGTLVPGGLSTAVIAATLTGEVRPRQDLAGPVGFWELVGIGPDGPVFSLHADRIDAKETTLVTISESGPRQGLVIAGTGPAEAGAPMVRTPG